MKKAAGVFLCLLAMFAWLPGCHTGSGGSTGGEPTLSNSRVTTTDTSLPASTVPSYEKVTPLYKDRYTTNFYVYEPCQDQNFGMDMGQYIKLVNTVLGYKTEIDWRFQDYPIYLSDFYDNTFDEFNPLAALVSDITYDSDANTSEITYRFNQKDHEKAIADIDQFFIKLVKDGMPTDAGDFIKTAVIYRNVMKSMNYYTGELRGKARLYTYDAMQTGLGVCHTYAYTSRFAMAQLGFETLQATGFVKDTGIYHEWFMAKLYDQWYHFDPTYEDNGSDQFGLRYFGMTAENRKERGKYYEVCYGKLDPYRKPVPEATDTQFAVFHNVVRFAVLNGTDVQCTFMGQRDYEKFIFTHK